MGLQDDFDLEEERLKIESEPGACRTFPRATRFLAMLDVFRHKTAHQAVHTGSKALFLRHFSARNPSSLG
jgi:hypothetical protein